MTSTWDIIAENFGFMLVCAPFSLLAHSGQVFGDLVFIQFFFGIQAW